MFLLFCNSLAPPQENYSDKYYVLYRGVHFPDHISLEERMRVCNMQGQPCVAAYSSQRNCWDTHHYPSDLKAKIHALQNLRRMPNSDASQGSKYHLLVSKYINDGDGFKRDMKYQWTEIRSLLSDAAAQYKAPAIFNDCDHNIFISTSLRHTEAFKFAMGHKEPAIYGPQLTVGYLDVFRIPAEALHELYGMDIVERYAHGRISIKDGQYGYLWQEEVLFPFLIPCEYHWFRLPVQNSGRVMAVYTQHVPRSMKVVDLPYFKEDMNDYDLLHALHVASWAKDRADDQAAGSYSLIGKQAFGTGMECVFVRRGIAPFYGASVTGAPMFPGEPTERLADAREQRSSVIDRKIENSSLAAQCYAAQLDKKSISSRTGEDPRLFTAAEDRYESQTSSPWTESISQYQDQSSSPYC